MNSLFRRLLGKSAPAKPSRQSAHPTTDSPATIADGSDNAMRRQLILVLLRDVMRRHGIAPQLIELEMLVVNSVSRGSGLYVRLVLKQWDPRLLNHAQAFQNQLLTDIARFEPKAREWLYGVSWELDMGDSCPYSSLPERAFWQGPVQREAPGAATPPLNDAASIPAVPAMPAPTAAHAASTPESEAMEDLNQLFFIRDREISQAAAEHGPREYEKTQPLPL